MGEEVRLPSGWWGQELNEIQLNEIYVNLKGSNDLGYYVYREENPLLYFLPVFFFFTVNLGVYGVLFLWAVSDTRTGPCRAGLS